jgi:hypothetical protein
MAVAMIIILRQKSVLSVKILNLLSGFTVQSQPQVGMGLNLEINNDSITNNRVGNHLASDLVVFELLNGFLD